MRNAPAHRGLLLVALLTVALAVLVPLRTAAAHAALVRSSPASQVQLVSAPTSIDLWFSEPLEPKFSSFELLGSDGRAITVVGIRVDSNDPTHLSGLPQRLRPGLYTVSYRNVSTQDGHEWTGTYSFTVLNPDGSVPSGESFAPERGGTRASPERIAGRWLGFTGWSFVGGGALLLLIAMRSSLVDVVVRRSAERVAQGLMLAALPLLLAAATLELIAQTNALDASTLDVLADTRFGTLWLWRQLALFALGTAVGLVILAMRRDRRSAALAMCVTIGLSTLVALATMSLMSHAAAAPGAGWAVVFDLLHLALAVTWLGGLFAIAALLARIQVQATGRQGGTARSALILGVIGPFSLLASTAVFVLSVTGLFRSFGELPTLGTLVETEYGRWLLVKLVMVLLLLGVAWKNRESLQRAARGGRQVEVAVQQLTRMLPIEALLGIAVLGVVAVLGQTPTARGVAPTQSPPSVQSYTGIETVEDLSMHLQVTPASVGPNELRVHIYPVEGGLVSGVQDVFFSFAATGRLGGERIAATSSGNGLYTASGNFLSLASAWEIRVDVRRPQGDVAATFAVPIGPSSSSSTRSVWASPAPQLAPMTIAGIVTIAVGSALICGASWLHRRLRGRALVAGGLAAFIGLWLTASGGTTPSAAGTNPVPVSAESIALGSTLYAANCATCHGTTGRGDGPQAAVLQPRPADLITHVPLHPRSDTYQFVANGFPASSMPAWKEQLTEVEIWHIVNYLREGMQR